VPGLSSDEIHRVSQGLFPAENTGLKEQVFSGNASIPKKCWLGATWYKPKEIKKKMQMNCWKDVHTQLQYNHITELQNHSTGWF